MRRWMTGIVGTAFWLGAASTSAMAQAIETPARAADPAEACAALGRLDLTRDPEAPATVLSAVLDAGTGDQGAFCKVNGVVMPQIQFEVRLPVSAWNGRYFQTGCGGFCGATPVENFADAQRMGFAVAAQNMGHVGSVLADPLWGESEALRRDYGRRSTEVVATTAKRLVETFYGRAPDYSYFRGCSTGGREALSIAQNMPEAFDGVIAGDPAFPARQGGIANLWDTVQLLRRDGTEVMPRPALTLLHRAVMERCDELDGVEDGILTDPRLCDFDVRSLSCVEGRPDECLDAEQVLAVQKLYDGPRNSAGRRLTPGGRMFGSELSWETRTRAGLAEGFVRFLAFDQNPGPDYTIWDFDFDQDVERLETWAAVYDAVAPYAAPDLEAFQAHGGKLMIYHGFADPTVSPINMIDFYAQVVHRQGGAEAVREWARLYLVPGMFHCRGGDAPNQFDMLEPMMAWVERGVAPDRITARQVVDGQVKRTLPLTPYPELPRYSGQGDVNDAANWAGARSTAADADERADWNWAPRD